MEPSVGGTPILNIKAPKITYCIICGGNLAGGNAYPTCGRCFNAGMTAKRQRREEDYTDIADLVNTKGMGRSKGSGKGEDGSGVLGAF